MTNNEDEIVILDNVKVQFSLEEDNRIKENAMEESDDEIDLNKREEENVKEENEYPKETDSEVKTNGNIKVTIDEDDDIKNESNDKVL